MQRSNRHSGSTHSRNHKHTPPADTSRVCVFAILAPDMRSPVPARRNCMNTGAAYGIRPESLKILGPDPVQKQKDITLTATVEIVEKLGDEQLIYCKSGNTSFIAKADSHVKVAHEQTFNFLVNLSRSHLFEPEKGINITV